MHAGGWRATAIALALVPVLMDAAQEVAREVAGGVWSYTVRPGDTLRSIAARYGVDVTAIRRDNALPAGTAAPAGTTLVLDNRHIAPAPVSGERMLVNVPQRMLFYFEHGALVRAFPVAVGQPDWATPLGAFTVLTKETSPTWDVPPSIQEEMRRTGQPVVTTVPPGPENPLGKYWMGLSISRIGIHGTPYTSSVYGATTHGCIRMHPDDVSVLFSLVQPGDAGAFVYQPVLIAEVNGGLLLEAHPDLYRLIHDDPRGVLRDLEHGGARIDWDAVDKVLSSRDGIARRIGLREITHSR